MKFTKYFLFLILTLSSMIHAEKKNRFERIVSRYPHLSVFLASAVGATAGVYVWKKFDQPIFLDTESKKQILFANPNLRRVAIAGTLVGTALAAVADCGMPRFAPKNGIQEVSLA